MLIIEIHVDTIESADTPPSTRAKREVERSKGASQKLKPTGNRYWNAIKLSIPGSLLPQNKTKDER